MVSVQYNPIVGEAVSFSTFPHASTVSSGGTSERAGAKQLHDTTEDGDANIFNPIHT